MHDLRSMTLPEMESLFLNQYNEKRFRATQVFEWINRKLAVSFDEMTNISRGLRSRLSVAGDISIVKIKEKYISNDGLTTKYLFELGKDTIIESVAMKYFFGWSVCVSTQAGCRMGCVFCASSYGGLSRNLSAGEICAQVYEMQKDIGERISHIVVMGSGEPFDNYDNLLKFIKIITHERGLRIGARHITVSTCGLTDKIREFANEGLQVNLAISLHAADQQLRESLMPITKKNSLEELFSACRDYSIKTGRRITYEYALIAGINDSASCAVILAKKLKQGSLETPHGGETALRAPGNFAAPHVNLIPLNEIPGKAYKRSDRKTVEIFMKTLTRYGIETTLRRTLGDDVNGACGQLRSEYLRK